MLVWYFKAVVLSVLALGAASEVGNLAKDASDNSTSTEIVSTN